MLVGANGDYSYYEVDVLLTNNSKTIEYYEQTLYWSLFPSNFSNP